MGADATAIKKIRKKFNDRKPRTTTVENTGLEQ